MLIYQLINVSNLHPGVPMKLIKCLLLILVLLATWVPAQADELAKERCADIDQLLRVTGAVAMGKQMATAVTAQLAQNLKKVRPDIPNQVLQVLPQEVGAVFEENMGSLMEAIVPLYAKYFTGTEVKELIRFYSTDLGKKLVDAMPGLMQESMQIGQHWGQSLAPAIERRVKARLAREGVRI
jgi:uncharacterized protein